MRAGWLGPTFGWRHVERARCGPGRVEGGVGRLSPRQTRRPWPAPRTVTAEALGPESASPPPRHGLSFFPLRHLRWRVRQLGPRGRVHAVPGGLRLPRWHPGGEEAGKAGSAPGPGPGQGRERAGAGQGRALPAALTAPPALPADPLPEHPALHRVAAAGGGAHGGDVPHPRHGDLPGGPRARGGGEHPSRFPGVDSSFFRCRSPSWGSFDTPRKHRQTFSTKWTT